jgi:hypothetical protein
MPSLAAFSFSFLQSGSFGFGFCGFETAGAGLVWMCFRPETVTGLGLDSTGLDGKIWELGEKQRDLRTYRTRIVLYYCVV